MKTKSHQVKVSKAKQSIIASVVSPLLTKATTIFDYGCSLETDYSYYSMATAVESYNCHKPSKSNKQRFDIVTLTYILNTLPKKSRFRVLHNAYNKVIPGGSLIVAVRANKSITNLANKRNWASYDDGFITSSIDATFQHGFTSSELESLLLMLNPMSMIQLLHTRDSICYSITKQYSQ